MALSLILVTATFSGTLQYQKAFADGGLLDKIKNFVKSIIEKCTHGVSTSTGTACNGPSGAAVQEGGGGAGGGAGCGGGGGGGGGGGCSGGGSSTGGGGGGGGGGGTGGGGGGGSGPVFGGNEAQGSDGSSGSIKVGPNSVTQTAKSANGETITRSVSR